MEWISIKDKFPLYKQYVLVLFDKKHCIKVITEAVYRGEYEKDIHIFRIILTGEDVESKYITHWMNLPEYPSEN